MARQWLWAGLGAALAAAVLLVTPSTSQAWGHWGGGWGGWGGWYSPYSYGWGWGGYPAYSSFGWTSPAYTYYGYYPYYSYYSYPYYTTYTYSQPTTSNYVSYYPSAAATGASNPNDAWVRVKVPANAEVWFGGYKTTQTGTNRLFYSPPLNPKDNYSYQVRARWTDNGAVKDYTEYVPVHAGETVTVNFFRPRQSSETSRPGEPRPQSKKIADVPSPFTLPTP
jgi:uncharacterized protein (TIGR03000 family)